MAVPWTGLDSSITLCSTVPKDWYHWILLCSPDSAFTGAIPRFFTAVTKRPNENNCRRGKVYLGAHSFRGLVYTWLAPFLCTQGPIDVYVKLEIMAVGKHQRTQELRFGV
ncbi:uncharacterized protein LOC144253648 [Urocitellus parryii]